MSRRTHRQKKNRALGRAAVYIGAAFLQTPAWFAVWLTGAALLSGSRAHAVESGGSDIESLYQSACAPCHGVRGQGLAADDPKRATFDPLPADLTDPLWSSSEPRRDWFQVIKEGGPVLGLSAQMPAYGEVLSDAQIDGLVGYVKSFAAAEGYPPGELNLIRPHVTKKPFPEDEALVLMDYQRLRGAPDAGRGVLYFAKRLGRRSQVELKLVQAFTAGESELDELELGFKHVLHHDRKRNFLLSGGLEAEIPIELEAETPRVLAYLSLAKPLGQRVESQTHVLYERGVPIGDGAVEPHALDLASALFFRWSASKRGVFPGIEGHLKWPLGGAESAGFSVVPQALARLSRRGHLAVSAGVEIPVAGPRGWITGKAFLLWEYGEGWPWQGW